MGTSMRREEQSYTKWGDLNKNMRRVENPLGVKCIAQGDTEAKSMKTKYFHSFSLTPAFRDFGVVPCIIMLMPPGFIFLLDWLMGDSKNLSQLHGAYYKRVVDE